MDTENGTELMGVFILLEVLSHTTPDVLQELLTHKSSVTGANIFDIVEKWIRDTQGEENLASTLLLLLLLLLLLDTFVTSNMFSSRTRTRLIIHSSRFVFSS